MSKRSIKRRGRQAPKGSVAKEGVVRIMEVDSPVTILKGLADPPSQIALLGAEPKVAVQTARQYNDGLAETIAACTNLSCYLGAAAQPYSFHCR